MRRGTVIVMGALLVGGLWGCAGSGKSPALPTVVDASAGDLVASEGLALWLGANGPSEVWMKISEGKDAGKSWHVVPTNIKKRAGGADGGEGAGGVESFMLMWTLEGEASARSEREMVVESDGDLTMARVVQRDRSVITVFDPPVLVMPARINSGAVVRQDGKVVVYELKNSKKVKEKGEFVLEARFDGEVEGSAASGGAGGRERLLTSRLELNLSAAKSERVTRRRFAPAPPAGNGALVSESFEEKIRVLGVTIESTRQTMVVAGSEGAEGATCDTDAGGSR